MDIIANDKIKIKGVYGCANSTSMILTCFNSSGYLQIILQTAKNKGKPWTLSLKYGKNPLYVGSSDPY